MLSIEDEDEPSPFNSVCFLLPMLCQTTMEFEGCKTLVSSGCYKAVVKYLIEAIEPCPSIEDDNISRIFLACDTITHLLLKKEQVQFSIDESTLVNLLRALGNWAENACNSQALLKKASSITALLLDYTSQKALLNHPNFNGSLLTGLSKIISRSLPYSNKDMPGALKEEGMDLSEVVSSGYSRWAPRFPRIRKAVERYRSFVEQNMEVDL